MNKIELRSSIFPNAFENDILQRSDLLSSPPVMTQHDASELHEKTKYDNVMCLKFKVTPGRRNWTLMQSEEGVGAKYHG